MEQQKGECIALAMQTGMKIRKVCETNENNEIKEQKQKKRRAIMISIKSDILDELEKEINHITIRNRSHLIEIILNDYLEKKKK